MLLRYLGYTFQAFDVRTNKLVKSSHGNYMGYICYWLHDGFVRHPPSPKENLERHKANQGLTTQ